MKCSRFGLALVIITLIAGYGNASKEVVDHSVIRRDPVRLSSASVGNVSSGSIGNSNVTYNDAGMKIEVSPRYSVGDGCPIEDVIDSLDNYSIDDNVSLSITGHEVSYSDDGLHQKTGDKIYFTYKYKSPYGFFINGPMVKSEIYIGSWLSSISAHDDYASFDFSPLEKGTWKGKATSSNTLSFLDVYDKDRNIYDALVALGNDDIPYTISFKNMKSLQERFSNFGEGSDYQFETKQPVADITFFIGDQTYKVNDVYLYDMRVKAYTGDVDFSVRTDLSMGWSINCTIRGENKRDRIFDGEIVLDTSSNASQKTTGKENGKQLQIKVNAPDGYVNLREGTSTYSKIITKITNDEVLDVIDTAKSDVNGKLWYKVKYSSNGKQQTGWVASSQVQVIDKSNGADSSKNNSEFIVDGSDSGYFGKGFFEDLSDEELRLARNEILARHGRMFKDEKLQKYFNSKSWYRPQYTPEEFDPQMESLLNEWEKANIELIKEVEAERK